MEKIDLEPKESDPVPKLSSGEEIYYFRKNVILHLVKTINCSKV